jgi:hypothetical protein
MELQRDFGGGVGTQYDRRRLSAGKFIAFARGELARRAEGSSRFSDRESRF